MLIATIDGQRIEAQTAIRGADHRCPACVSHVILKRGEIKIAHFAHEPHSKCPYGFGETIEHLQAKADLCTTLRWRGLKAEVEYVIGDQRADVVAWTKNDDQFVVELQHTNIAEDDLERRMAGYFDNQIRQIWLPVRNYNHRPLAMKWYKPRVFETKAIMLYGKRSFCYDPSCGGLRYIYKSLVPAYEDEVWRLSSKIGLERADFSFPSNNARDVQIKVSGHCPVDGCGLPTIIKKKEQPGHEYCPRHAPDDWLTSNQKMEYERVGYGFVEWPPRNDGIPYAAMADDDIRARQSFRQCVCCGDRVPAGRQDRLCDAHYALVAT